MEYLKYQISHIQKKQMAESIAKVVCKRVIGESSYYEVTLEEGMGVGPIWMSESELTELN